MMDGATTSKQQESARLLFCDECHCYYLSTCPILCKHEGRRWLIDPMTFKRKEKLIG